VVFKIYGIIDKIEFKYLIQRFGILCLLRKRSKNNLSLSLEILATF